MSESQFGVVPEQKGDEERQNCHLACSCHHASFPCCPGLSRSLQLPGRAPLLVLGTDAVAILELLDWPCCRKLPLSQASFRSSFIPQSSWPSETSGERHRRGLCFILTSTGYVG